MRIKIQDKNKLYLLRPNTTDVEFDLVDIALDLIVVNLALLGIPLDFVDVTAKIPLGGLGNKHFPHRSPHSQV